MAELITFTIQANGQVIPENIMVFSIECNSQLNNSSIAQITFTCPSDLTDNVSNSITQLFKLNTEVIIEAGYNNLNKVIFTGIVSKQKVTANATNSLFVIITCKSKEPIIIPDKTPKNVALTLTYGEDIMSLDFSTDKNSISSSQNENLYETKGLVKFQGSSLVEAGSFVSVTNIGDSFNKTYVATGITHNIIYGEWITEAYLAFKESILA